MSQSAGDFLDPVRRGQVVEAVAEADHGLRGRGFEVPVKFLQRGLRLVGGQEGAAAAGEAFGFAEVQVGNGQRLPRGPVEGAAGQEVQRLAVEEECMVHGR